MDRSLDVAVVGVGCLFPRAGGKNAYWANIVGGVDAIREVPPSHWNAADYLNADPKKPDHVYTARGGFLDPVDFDSLEFGVSPNNLEATDASQLLALSAVQQALADAGYGPNGRTFDRKRTSVLLGVTGTLQLVIPLGARLGHPIWRMALRDAGVDMETAEDVVARISDAYVPWQENSFPGLLGNVVAGRIANRFDFGGSNCVVDAACASSLAAIHLAAMELESGRADMVVTGGVDAFNDVFMFMCFSKTPALSPTGDVRPFDQSGDGTILGEGLGIVLLKRRADAERDGDRIYAVLKGIGTSSDGRGNAIYAPTAKGQRECLLNAYGAANVSPATVELIEAHGTGTRVGDGVEASALTEVFGESGRQGRWCALGSVKSQIGHTKAAAGAAGLIKATLALHHKVLPPTIKVENPVEPLNGEANPFYVNAEPRPWVASPNHPRRAGISSFGFGGSNFHAVLEEHSPDKLDVDWDAEVEIAAFSASSHRELSTRVESWTTGADVRHWDRMAIAAAESRRAFRADEPFRLVAVLEKSRNSEQVFEQLKFFASASDESKFRENPLGVYAGEGPAPGELAFLFPGQGSQYVGMLRDFVCRFPEMLDSLTEAEREILDQDPSAARLSEVVFPPFAFEDAAKSSQEERLRATEWAQPALGAVSAGLLALFERFGLRADVFAGHSYGELAALYAAKTYDAQTLHRLSRFRGKAMAARNGDPGAMLAVSAPIEDVERFLDETKSSLVVANRNAPRQAVLSGSAAAIESATQTFAARNIRTHRLNVSNAFHSPLVAPAAAEFADRLSATTFVPPDKPVFANATGEIYAGDPRSTLADQLARPVEFVELVRNMHRHGVRTFIEVGPSAKLIGLVRSILDEAPHQTAAVDASSGNRSGMADFARVLAKCAALGHKFDLAKWNPNPPPVKPAKTKSTVELLGINYVAPKTPRPPRVKSEAKEKPPTKSDTAPLSRQSAATSPARIDSPPATAVRNARPMTPPPVANQDHDLLREGMFALQRSQEQTAELHRQFLEGQALAQQSLLAILGQRPLTTIASPRSQELPAPITRELPLQPPAALSPASPSLPAPPTPLTSPTPPATPAFDVGGLLLEIVAEKTGYPREMLNLEMGLDADLGIDSIKRVEILSAVQDRAPAVRRLAADELGTLRTLNDAVRLLSDMPMPAAVPMAAGSTDQAGDVLLEFVAEKTGYPREMLNLEMGLDADLGIDSIKRVEILSAVQDRLPNARKIAADELGVLRTLADVANAIAPARGIVARTEAPITPPSAAADRFPIAEVDLGDLLLKIVADKTGYPVEMLRLDMGLDADLGIDSIKRVEILSSLQEAAPSLPKVNADQLGAIRTLADIVTLLGSVGYKGESQAVDAPNSARPAKSAVESRSLDVYVPTCRPLETANRRRIGLGANAVVWIVGPASERRDGLADAFRRRQLDAHAISVEEALSRDELERVAGLVFVPNDDDALDRACQAFAVLQRCAEPLKVGGAKGRALLGALLEFDGEFGLGGVDHSAIRQPRQASLAGLVKTARFEWTGIACKVVDADRTADADDLAEEFLTDGPIEVGVRDGRRTMIRLEIAKSFRGSEPVLRKGDLVVVSGGGRGVTAVVAEALAKKFGVTTALLGRSRLVDEQSWLAGAGSEADVKRLLLAHSDDRPSPKRLSERSKDVFALREIRRNLNAIHETGGWAIYRTVDVRNRDEVTATLEDLRREFGPVRGLVHGAGVLRDRLIVDKKPEDYEEVYRTKVDGIENLLAAVEGDELRLLALFSSSTARFGRMGQSDYAAANETLNKIAQRERRQRPGCRVASFNWGPWNGGMVDDRLKAVFAEEGVAVIPQQAGAAVLADWATGDAAAPTEIVVLGSGSRKPTDDTSNGSPEIAATNPSNATFVFDRVVDLATHPVLRSHVIKNSAVVPAALSMEWMAHAASLRNPGLVVHGADDFRVFTGIKLREGERAPLSFWCERTVRVDGGFNAPVEIRSERGGKTTVHARATIVLRDRLPTAEARPTIPSPIGEAIELEAAYGEFLFHGTAMRAFSAIDAVGKDGAAALLAAQPNPTDWFDRPVRSRWCIPPLAVDAAFQLAILWSRINLGAACLPTKVGAFRQFAGRIDDETRLIARFSRTSDAACVGDFEYVRSDHTVVARLFQCEFVVDRSLNEAFRLRECGVGT